MTLKDHKENFLNPTFIRSLNPYKDISIRQKKTQLYPKN